LLREELENSASRIFSNDRDCLVPLRTEALLDYLRVIYAGDLLNGKGPI
jgi:hypothetical protein